MAEAPYRGLNQWNSFERVLIESSGFLLYKIVCRALMIRTGFGVYCVIVSFCGDSIGRVQTVTSHPGALIHRRTLALNPTHRKP